MHPQFFLRRKFIQNKMSVGYLASACQFCTVFLQPIKKLQQNDLKNRFAAPLKIGITIIKQAKIIYLMKLFGISAINQINPLILSLLLFLILNLSHNP